MTKHGFTVALALLVAGLGGVALAGWLLGYPRLLTPPHQVAMKANSALGLLLVGASLCLRLMRSRFLPAAQGLAVFVGLLGAVTLLEEGMGWDLGLDQFLVRESSGDAGTPFPGRMAPNTALSFILAGWVLAFPSEGRVWGRIQDAACYAMLFLASLVLVGYLYGMESNFGVAAHTHMALATAAALAILATALILYRLEGSALAFLASRGTGARMAKWLLPPILLVPLLVGWLRGMGQGAGLFGSNYGTALMATAVSAALAAGVLLAGRTLERLDQERRQALEQLVRQSTEIQDLYDRAPCGYHSLDAGGRILRMNDTELKWLGYVPEEVIGRMRAVDLMTEDSAAQFAEAFPVFLRQGYVHNQRFRFRRKDGSILPVLVNASAVRDAEGNFLMSRSTVQDMTELERAEQRVQQHQAELEEANRELARKNADLDEFAGVAGHDLREPLRKLIAFSDLLKRDLPADLPLRAAEDLAYLGDAARRLDALLQNLLLLARAGKEAMDQAPVRLDECLDVAVGDLEASLRETGAVLRRGPLPEVRGDREMLTRVLENLLANALKFCRPGEAPRLWIDAARRGSEWVVCVGDEGIGIPSERLGEIFEPFRRLHGKGRYAGSGLGLAICRKVLERHGGRIWAESREGEGTQVFIALPVSEAPEPTTRSSPSKQEVP